MNQKTAYNWTKHGGMRSLLKRAIECGVEISIVPGQERVLKLSYKKSVAFLKGSNAPVMRRMGNFTRDKELTKILLDEIGIRTPRGIVADSFESAIRFIKKSGMPFPLILKPTHGSRALGVTWNIRSEDDLSEAFSNFGAAKKEHGFKKNTFLVEEMFIGREHRVLVLDNDVISCVEKIPASVVGDGKSPIKKLIREFNRTRLPGFKLKVDAVVEKTLKDSCFTLDSVLASGHALRLRNNLNMSDGGRSIDVTKTMHPSFRDICVKATQISGLLFSGVDVIAHDISKPARKNNYVILELNPNPYYNMNEKPLAEGKGTDVSFLLLKQLFPELKKQKIPS
jgi:cyanophycin synthetase